MPDPRASPDTPVPDVTSGRWRVRHLADVDSTNRYALDAARAGEAPGLVVTADHQAAGRGRRDRAWLADRGTSLLVSVLVEVGDEVVARLPLAGGLALAEAVEAVAGIRVALKWPNDLVVGEGERKLAGLLCEGIPGRPGFTVAVVGAGCNVAQVDLPAELGAATSIARETGVVADRELLLHAFLDRFARRLDAPTTVVPSVRLRLTTVGRRVRVERADGPLVGDAIDLGPEGQLLVRDARGAVTEVFAGDVVHLRDEPPVQLP